MPAISPDSHVTLHYRMALVVHGAEKELVNTFGAAPATLQMGAGQWAQTVENRLLGLEEGALAEFELAPDQAYGVHNPQLVRTLSSEQLRARCEPGAALVVGESVQINDVGALPVRGVLAALDGGHAVVDFNHPLAGLPMRVRVLVIGVL